MISTAKEENRKKYEPIEKIQPATAEIIKMHKKGRNR